MRRAIHQLDGGVGFRHLFDDRAEQGALSVAAGGARPVCPECGRSGVHAGFGVPGAIRLAAGGSHPAAAIRVRAILPCGARLDPIGWDGHAAGQPAEIHRSEHGVQSLSGGVVGADSAAPISLTAEERDKLAVDNWLTAAGISTGPVFLRSTKPGESQRAVSVRSHLGRRKSWVLEMRSRSRCPARSASHLCPPVS